jgi:hypothetical protein
MAFLCVSQQGGFKNTTNHKNFLGKPASRRVESLLIFTSYKKTDSSRFPPSSCFIFYRIFGCFSAREFKTPPKTFYKIIVPKGFYFLQKNQQKIQNRFVSRFVYHVFGRFSVRGVKKHHKKYQKNKTDSGPFLASGPPTTYLPTGVPFFWGSFGGP